MTTRLSILILAATVAPALASAPRTTSRAAPPPAPPTASAPAKASAAKFSDIHAGLEGASSQDCLGCHADTRPVIQAHTSHPIDLDYAEVAGKRSADLKPLTDVLAGGIAVPGGKVVCLTCHALSSPWKYHLAMPAGATLRPAVRLGDPSSYEGESTSPPQPGSEVSPMPLCRACHVY